MAIYKEFRPSNQRRRRKKQLQRALVLLILAVLILGTAYFIVKIVEGFGKDGADSSQAVSDSTSGSSGEEITQNWTPNGPVKQTINFEIIVPDTRMIAVPSNGRIETSYFDDAMFVGDSLTVGFSTYNVMPNSKVVAYIGMGPQSFEGVQTLDDGTQVVPLQQIVSAQPRKIYLMLGTNSLISMTDDAFLVYYGQLLDKLLQQDPGVEIYVESILPVSAQKAAERPQLDNTRIRAVNDRLAKLAFEKGVYFLNVQEVFTDDSGNMIESALWSASEGIHLQPAGYNIWKDYLYTHVAHKVGNPYVQGSPYYDGGQT